MPRYEYRCPSCGHEFERRAGMTDPDPACPECGAAVVKVPSRTSFSLRGGGWGSDSYEPTAPKKD